MTIESMTVCASRERSTAYAYCLCGDTCSTRRARQSSLLFVRTSQTVRCPRQRGPNGLVPGDGVVEVGRQSRRRLVSPSEAMPTRDDLHYLIPVPYLLSAFTRTIRPNMCEVALHITLHMTYDRSSISNTWVTPRCPNPTGNG